MEVEFDESVIHSGMMLHGRLSATFQDRVTVELETMEAAFPKPVTMARTEATAENGYEFELSIPPNAIDFTVGRADVRWRVAASERGLSGHDMERPITIVAPDRSTDLDVADSEIDALLQANNKKRQSLGNGEIVFAAMFMLFGLGILGAGIYTAVAPPDSFDGTRTPAYVMMAMSLCFFLPGFIRIRSVYRPGSIKGIESVSGTRSARRGEELAVELAFDDDVAVRVGHVTTLGTFAELSHRHVGKRPRGGGFIFTVIHESWQAVDAANPTATFTVPDDIAPTYTGRAVLVMHHIRVQPASSSSTKWNTRRLEVPVAVLP